MRAIIGANRVPWLIGRILGVALGGVASSGAGPTIADRAVAQARACAAMADVPPIRVWRDGRFAEPSALLVRPQVQAWA